MSPVWKVAKVKASCLSTDLNWPNLTLAHKLFATLITKSVDTTRKGHHI